MTEGQVHSPLCLKTFALGVGLGDTMLARDIALSVPAGHGLMLRGPNGAGKSTLLLTLAGLLSRSKGRWCWKGMTGILVLLSIIVVTVMPFVPA